MTILSDYQNRLTVNPHLLEPVGYYAPAMVRTACGVFDAHPEDATVAIRELTKLTAELLLVLDIHEISAEARSSARARIGGQNPVLLSLLFRMHQLYTAQVDDPRRLGFQAEKLWVLLVDRAEEITGHPFSVEG